jgi:hypothetical protein
MVPGFKQRLYEELLYTIANTPKYETVLGELAPRIKFADNINPPNILSWVGASLLGSLNGEIERFLITKEEFLESGLPDRFGNCFLKPARSDSLEVELKIDGGAPKKYYAETDETRFSEAPTEMDEYEVPQTKRVHNYFNKEFDIAMKKHKNKIYSTQTPYSKRGYIT